MKLTEILKAGLIGSQEIENHTIVIAGTSPEFEELQQYARHYQSQAVLLVDALFASLPGGTVDALLCELLSRRASLLRVPFIEVPESKKDRQTWQHIAKELQTGKPISQIVIARNN